METVTNNKTDNRTTHADNWPQVGTVCETYGVNSWLMSDGRRRGFVRACWRRYLRGDWGIVNSDDAAANKSALLDGSRILATYRFQGRKVWIITEAVGDDGRRAYTTILFPSEY